MKADLRRVRATRQRSRCKADSTISPSITFFGMIHVSRCFGSQKNTFIEDDGEDAMQLPEANDNGGDGDDEMVVVMA